GHTGALGRGDRRVRTFLPFRDALASLGAGEAVDRRRARERLPRREHRERRDEGDAVALHRGADVVVELHAVLDGIDAGFRGDLGTGEIARVRRDTRAARVHRLHRGADVRDLEWRILHTAWRVHVELHQVGAEIEL